MRSTRVGAATRVYLAGAAALLVIACSAWITTRPLLEGHSEVRQVRRDDGVLQQVGELRAALSTFQVFVEPRMSHLAPASATDLATGALDATAVSARAASLIPSLARLGLTGAAGDLRAADATFSRAYTGLDILAPGRSTPEVSAAVAKERAAFGRMWDVSGRATGEVRGQRDLDLREAMQHLDDGRATVLAADGVAALIVLAGAGVLALRARRRERAEHDRTEHEAFERSLQQALEMSGSETDVYDIVARAFHESVPRLQVEMLVADSSRAHFHQTLSVASDGAGEHSGCGVVSPLDCPATIRGRTLVFRSSRGLDACPHLRDRASGDCSAACVAISMAGKAVGVAHAIGPDGAAPTPGEIDQLEMTSQRASDRIAMLRAFERSETQARSDPLTGLLNRRSLENRVRELRRDGAGYALAYGDLDHFKILNDTHGHEAGDQALRLFSRVLRDSIRPNDIAARYGGEEFVVVLPDCGIDTAAGVLERVRERLALALTTGRVPAFTVSFGLASSGDGAEFEDVLAVADHALLDAKAAGRNRIVIAASGAPLAPARPRAVRAEPA